MNAEIASTHRLNWFDLAPEKDRLLKLELNLQLSANNCSRILIFDVNRRSE